MSDALLPSGVREKILVDEGSGCWLWRGTKSYKGYGWHGGGKRKRPAHRVIYALLVGPIPDGLTLDHLCRVRLCVNPAHLEPVTNAENIRRGEGACARNARKMVCPRGHPYSGENLHITTRGWRSCRACERAYQRNYQEKRRA